MDEEDFLIDKMYEDIESNMSNNKLSSPFNWYKMIYKSFETKTDTKYPLIYFDVEFNRYNHISSKDYFMNKVNEHLDNIIDAFNKVIKKEDLEESDELSLLKECICPMPSKISFFGNEVYYSEGSIYDKHSTDELSFNCSFNGKKHISYNELIALKRKITKNQTELDSTENEKTTTSSNLEHNEKDSSGNEDKKEKYTNHEQALINLYAKKEIFTLTSKGRQIYNKYLHLNERIGAGTKRENKYKIDRFENAIKYLKGHKLPVEKAIEEKDKLLETISKS